MTAGHTVEYRSGKPERRIILSADPHVHVTKVRTYRHCPGECRKRSMFRLPIDRECIVAAAFVGEIVDHRPSEVYAFAHAAHRRDDDVVAIAKRTFHYLDRTGERAMHECTCMNNVVGAHDWSISFAFEGNGKT